MPWMVGIDEAGLGPNLGPLVQSAVAIHVADGSIDLWDKLSAVVRRASPRDHRIPVDDSKAIHQGPGGKTQLRSSVVRFFPQAASLPSFVKRHGLATSSADLDKEFWYRSARTAPAIDLPDPDLATSLHDASATIVEPRCVITPTSRFNEVLSQHGTKAAVTGRGVIELICDAVATREGSIVVQIDKQGGRNFYAALIQSAIPDGWVTPMIESAAESLYRIDGLGRDIRVIVRPRAESQFFAVALASMLSKYVREGLMDQFNAFWRERIPDLKPTAGYPTDANRYYAEIVTTAVKLGISRDAIWRNK